MIIFRTVLILRDCPHLAWQSVKYFSVGKLLDLHGEKAGEKTVVADEKGEAVERPEGYEPPVVEAV